TQVRGMCMKTLRGGTEERAEEVIRPAPAEPAPCAVAHASDHRLDEEYRQRRRQPQHRDLLRLRPEVLVDGAHVRHLQPPAELDAEETEGHVPYLPETQTWLVHGTSR